MNRLKKYIFFLAAVLILAVGSLSVWLSSRYTIPVMMYHNVDYTDASKANTVSPERFEWHMAYLQSHGFKVISFGELVGLIESGTPLPRKRVVISFDDGYADNYYHAFRILKKYGFPAIIFASSDLVGTEGYLTWAQMKEMISNGITIGSHTQRHTYLPDLLGEKQREEIFESKRVFEENLGVSVDYFAYPSGGFNDAVKGFVKEAGYKGAAATNRGYDRLNKDVFELNRIRFSDQDHRKDYLWIKLSGYYNLFRKAKHPY